MGFDEAALHQILDRLPEASGWLLAYSGGLDSEVLLHALARLAADADVPLRALHVHHGLMPEADAWEAHVRHSCARLGLPLRVVRLDLRLTSGESLEAVARTARYRALAEALHPREMLFTAHHQDDQAETLLLQALRGAGISGLAGMPLCRSWASGWHARPLLGFDREDLRRWARAEGLDWVEDPSNDERRFDRNYLRHELMPVLRARWPAAARTLARSAAHLAESLDVLREVADADLATCRAGSELDVTALRALSLGRRTQVIRAWIRERGHRVPDQRRMREIEAQMIQGRSEGSPRVDWDGVSLRRYRHRLYLTPSPLPRPPSAVIDWSRPTTLPLPAGCGELRLEAAECGISRRAWAEGRVQIRWGETPLRCRPPGRVGARSLKRLCQEWGVPPWRRPYLPLIFVDGQLASVAGLGLCEGPIATSGDNLRPVWRPE